MFDMKNFALFLVGKRREKNITQGQLADMLGVSHQAVSKWERGESMPEISKLPDLSSALSVPTEDIVAAMHTGSEIKNDNACLDNEYYALPDKTLVGDVYALAPYLSRDTLISAITEIVLSKGSAIAKMLFKFADEAALRDVAIVAFESDTDKGRADLLPYLPQDRLTKLILNRYSSGEQNTMLLLLPYSKEFDVVDMIFKAIVSKHGCWDPFQHIIGDIMSEVVIENGIELAIKRGINCFNGWWSRIGAQNIAEIFMGYCRRFDHSFGAWSQIAPYMHHADTRVILAELDKMKSEGYDFNMTVNPAQLNALPPDVRAKLVSYGMKADVENYKMLNSLRGNSCGDDENSDYFESWFEELEGRIDELEGMISDLECRIDELE